MSELIADLDYPVVDATGAEYYVSVAAEMASDARWKAWLNSYRSMIPVCS